MSSSPLPLPPQACVNTLDEALDACRRISYPIMLKASWGGGGKGIRMVGGAMTGGTSKNVPSTQGYRLVLLGL